MKICIDLQGAQTDSRHRGIGRYTLALTRKFAKVATARHDIHLMFNSALGGIEPAIGALGGMRGLPRMLYGPIRGTSADNPAHDPKREAAEQVLAQAMGASGADVVWLSSLVEGFTEDALTPSPVAGVYTVATLYDLIPLQDAGYLGRSRSRDWYFRRLDALKRCDLLLSISAWVRQDAIDRLGIAPDRIVNIGAGVNESFTPAAAGTDHRPQLRERFSIERPFIMYNGGFDKRKNVDALLEAFAALPTAMRDKHQLVLVGRTDTAARRQLDQLAKRTGLSTGDVVYTGFVTDEDLIRLYQACTLFVFPSELEGFGLPPLEAMACGAPVIVNSATSLPEVVGRAEALFDAAIPGAMTRAMQDALADPVRRRRLSEEGLRRAADFDWTNTAQRALDAIETHCASTPPVAPVSTISTLPASHPSDVATAVSDATLPIYQLNATNVAQMLPLLRQWPGLVEWSGPFPVQGNMPAADRFRVYGYAGMCRSELEDTWIPLLQHDAIAFRLADTPHNSMERDAWIRQAERHPLTKQRLTENDIAQHEAARLSDNDLAQIADALDRCRPNAKLRWLVDVTHIAQHDLHTGIQRVVRSILGQWLRDPPAGVSIEPIAFRDGRYYHAHDYACRLLGVSTPPDLPGDQVAITGNEVFVGLDWAMESLPSSAALLHSWRLAGVAMHFIIHDLLPVTLPKAFHPQTRTAFMQWLQHVADLGDALHCVSQSTADDMVSWLTQAALDPVPVVASFPLGTDLDLPNTAVIPAAPLAGAMATRPSILMVGTLEPRKGHDQALEAFELLWSAGVDVNLVIVGKRGWLVNDILDRLDKHEEQGRHLFWLEDADDGMLHGVYAASTALLAASLGEGFGLPIIEAARRGKPVIARELPVFREVAGDYPSYFRGERAADLATHITRWLTDRPIPGNHPYWANWKESAQALANAISANSKRGYWTE